MLGKRPAESIDGMNVITIELGEGSATKDPKIVAVKTEDMNRSKIISVEMDAVICATAMLNLFMCLCFLFTCVCLSVCNMNHLGPLVCLF